MFLYCGVEMQHIQLLVYLERRFIIGMMPPGTGMQEVNYAGITHLGAKRTMNNVKLLKVVCFRGRIRQVLWIEEELM